MSKPKRISCLNFILNYVKDIKVHQKPDRCNGRLWLPGFYEGKPGFPDVAANGTVVTPAGNPFKTQNTLISFFSRLNYSLMNHYLLTVNCEGGCFFKI